MNDSIFPFLVSQAAKLPLLLVYLVALILSAVHWREGGATAKLAAFGFALLLGEWLSRAGWMYGAIYGGEVQGSAQDRILGSAIVGVAMDLLQFAGTVLIAVALFTRGRFGDSRAKAPAESAEDS